MHTKYLNKFITVLTLFLIGCASVPQKNENSLHKIQGVAVNKKTGVPIVNAKVRLRLDQSSRFFSMKGSLLLQETKTDQNGKFYFLNVLDSDRLILNIYLENEADNWFDIKNNSIEVTYPCDKDGIFKYAITEQWKDGKKVVNPNSPPSHKQE